MLLTELHRAGKPDWSRAVIVGSHHQARRSGPKPGRARSTVPGPGSKHHVITDAGGTPLAITLTGGNRHDITQLLPLLDAIPRIRGVTGHPRHRPRQLFADGGHDFDNYRRFLWKRGIKPVIARRGVPRGSCLGSVR
ncbi:transposase [Streptomyces sp. WC2508]|uniref:transposase n=1 Tax=Streptomyces sp. WC2508 TaxID=3461405 RepID=UPI004044A9C4